MRVVLFQQSEYLLLDLITNKEQYPDGGYILVVIDTFTRWVELYHSPDATAGQPHRAYSNILDDMVRLHKFSRTEVHTL